MIYIQSNKERTLPHHFDCSCALFGAQETCQEFRLTTYEEVASGKFDQLIRKSLFVGSTEFMTEVFKRVGLSDVRLSMNSDRPHEVITLEEAMKRATRGTKLFIKPVRIKLFTGLVLDGMQYTCLAGLPPDTLVMAYEPFTARIISEWRIYVKRGEVIDGRHYAGDFRVNPDWNHAEWAAKKYKNLADSFTMDVATLDNGSHAIIEFNDAWAIGNYGIPNDLYLDMLKTRYSQIMS